MKQWLTVICVGVFLLIVGIFFYPTILSGKLPVPADTLIGLYHPWRDLYATTNPRGVPFKNFLITDPVRQQIPWRKIAIDQWKKRQIPLWNPYTFSGTPLAANIQAGVFYPFNFLFFLFDFPMAWTLLIVLQPLLAGVFVFAYLRHHSLHPTASLLGAVAWSFSGFNVAWLTWGTMGHVALWLPLALLAIDKSWSFILVFSLVSQFFAGHAQISLYLFLVVISYGALRIYQAKERKKAALLFIFLLSLVAILTAVQWMPLLDWTRQSSRVIDGSDWHKEGWFIPWAHLVQFVAPDFFGNPTTLNYWGQWNYGEFVGYIGVLPLVFAFGAIVSGRNTIRLFWTGVSAVALLFALPTPISYLPFILKVPVLSSLQPTRLLFVVDFSLAVLAAFGCHAWLEGAKKGRWVWVIALVGAMLAVPWGVAVVGSLEISMRNLVLPTVVFFVGATLVIMYHRVKHVTMFRNIVTWSIVGLAAVDMLRFGWKFTPFTPREYFFPETAAIGFLQKQEKPFRVMSLDKRISPPNVSAYYGIESVEGYDPLIAGRYEELMVAIARGKPDITPPFGFNRIITLEHADSPFLPMLNVRYVLTLTDIERPFLKKVFQEGETRVYEYTRVLPRAFLVDKVQWVDSKQEALNVLFDRAFSPQTTAVVEKQTRMEGAVYPTKSSRGKITVVFYSVTKLIFETETDRDGFLVVSASYSPDWHVKIDGNAQPHYRTNYNFLGTLVPSGMHRVEFSL